MLIKIRKNANIQRIKEKRTQETRGFESVENTEVPFEKCS